MPVVIGTMDYRYWNRVTPPGSGRGYANLSRCRVVVGSPKSVSRIGRRQHLMQVSTPICAAEVPDELDLV